MFNFQRYLTCSCFNNYVFPLTVHTLKKCTRDASMMLATKIAGKLMELSKPPESLMNY